MLTPPRKPGTTADDDGVMFWPVAGSPVFQYGFAEFLAIGDYLSFAISIPTRWLAVFRFVVVDVLIFNFPRFFSSGNARERILRLEIANFVEMMFSLAFI